MNANERVIVGMILERLQMGEGYITSLFKILHERTQAKVRDTLGERFMTVRGTSRNENMIDLSTDSRKMKAVNSFQEMLND